MKKFVKWLDEHFEESILMVLLIAISCVMMAQVIMRYFFRQSMSWPEEFCRFAFIYSGFISMGYCVRNGMMLKVDILLGLFPKFLQTILDGISRVITFVFFGYLTYHAYLATAVSKKGGMTSPALELPMYIIYASVLIGAALGFIRQGQDLVKFFMPFFKKKEEEKTEEVA